MSSLLLVELQSQSFTAFSPTEVELYTAVSASKAILYLRYVLCEINVAQKWPTKIFEDNETCIKVINAKHPTDCTKHIDTPYLRLQSWKILYT